MLVLPWSSSGARSTVPPNATPIAWWPRHTPNSGVFAAAHALTSGIDAPARSGVPGPGDSSTPSNSSAAFATSASVAQAVVVVAPDLRMHSELSQVLDQVEHEAVVVVDDQDLHQPRLPGAAQYPIGPAGLANRIRTGSVCPTNSTEVLGSSE